MCTVISVEKGGPATMFDAFEAAEKRGEARGEAIGEARILKLLKHTLLVEMPTLNELLPTNNTWLN